MKNDTIESVDAKRTVTLGVTIDDTDILFAGDGGDTKVKIDDDDAMYA